MLFDRAIEIDFLRSDGQRVTLSGDEFRISFEASKSYTVTENFLSATVYNLSDETTNLLQSRDGLLTIKAGYKQSGGLKLVSQGNVTQIDDSYDAPNRTLTLTAGDGVTFNRETLISLSFAKGTSASNVLNAIINEMGATLRPLDFAVQGSYPNGFTFYGPARLALDKVVNRIGAEWSFQNNEIQIVKEGEFVQQQAIVLNKASGLVGRPQRRDDVGERLLFDAYKSGWLLNSLLFPEVEPGTPLIVQSDIVNGTFRCQEISHSGDNWGNSFNSAISVVEAGLE